MQSTGYVKCILNFITANADLRTALCYFVLCKI